MWEERQTEYSSIWPTLLAIGGCAMVAMIVVIDVLGMITEGPK